MLPENKLARIIGVTKAALYHEPIVAMCKKYDINTPTRYAYFMANILSESANFTVGVENMNYTSFERIKKIFAGSRSKLLTVSLVRNPMLLANTVYGGAWGRINLGNTDPGDGWKYRGRGPMQTTGRESYTKVSRDVFGDERLVQNPDLILEPAIGIECAAWEFKRKGCNKLADDGNFKAVVKAINGGYTNISDRLSKLSNVENLL